MRLSYKYRIYPNDIQRKALDDSLYLCRYLYNSALQERRSYYKRYGKGISYHSQSKELKEITELFPEFKSVYSQTRQQVLMQLDSAFNNFFRRVKAGENPGYPRFKGRDAFNSISFPQPKADLSGGGVKRLPNNKLQVFGIPGEIKVWWHRPFKGRCKQVRLCREGDKYYIVLSCDEVPKEPLAKTGKEVGIDLGITSFITTDDGAKLHHPRALKVMSQKLIAAQQIFDRKKKGSKNKLRAKLRLAHLHERTSNIRKDFLHKTALQLCKDYDKIILEKLDISAMMQNSDHKDETSLHKSIADASWSYFANILSYKAERADKEVIFVDPKNTSKTCSCCGHVQNMPLEKREFHCGRCESILDRDVNAAINIKRRGSRLAMSKGISEAHEFIRE